MFSNMFIYLFRVLGIMLRSRKLLQLETWCFPSDINDIHFVVFSRANVRYSYTVLIYQVMSSKQSQLCYFSGTFVVNLYQGGSKFSAPLFSSVFHGAAHNHLQLPLLSFNALQCGHETTHEDSNMANPEKVGARAYSVYVRAYVSRGKDIWSVSVCRIVNMTL